MNMEFLLYSLLHSFGCALLAQTKQQKFQTKHHHLPYGADKKPITKTVPNISSHSTWESSPSVVVVI
jgi:hypothetical protein